MKVTVTIAAQLDERWGVEDLFEAVKSKRCREDAILELVREDVAALLDDAKWSISVDEVNDD